MAYAKLGLDGLSVPAKIQYGRRIITAVTGNPNFLEPHPDMPVFTTATDSMEITYNEAKAARLVAKTKTQLQDQAEAAFDGMVSQLASYVDNRSAGDGTIIESAGFAVRATPTSVGELPAPTDLQAKSGEHPGHADVKWKGLYGAKAYNIERATDSAELSWQFMGSTTKSEASLNSMLSGKKYWFRVAAVGAAGTSAWSDPVPLVAQ